METMDISVSLLRLKTGFSLDYGSSIVKFVYVTDIGNGKSRLHFTYSQHEDFEAGLDFIKEKVGSSLTPGQEVIVTGVGVKKHIDLINKKLNIRVNHKLEIIYYSDGLRFLVNSFPLHDVVEPLSEPVVEHARSLAKQWVQALENMSGECEKKLIVPACLHNIDNIKMEPLATEKVTYPLLSMVAGSASGIALVNEDGTFNFLDIHPIGGRTFLGLGAVLAKTKSFEELVSAASKGNVNHVNHTLTAAIGEGDDNAYDAVKADLNLFSMAGCIGQTLDDFSSSDMAAGVVSLIATDTAMYAFTWAKALKAEHVFIIGGLPASSKMIRDEIAKVFITESFSDQMGFHPKPVFVKLGKYSAALGALLANIKQ